MNRSVDVAVYAGPALGAYGFPGGHPFSPRRLEAFETALGASGLGAALRGCAPVSAGPELIARFHAPAHVRRVARLCGAGEGWLDGGDTPAVRGLYEAASTVVGSTVDAVRRVMAGEFARAFVPIAGLHHAGREAAAGFCVFNDCGVAIETLRAEFGVERIAYVDIDAHHGDGVFYAYEHDPDLVLADIHEDGRFLYPGTGAAEETGAGAAVGTKLNLPLPPLAGDARFLAAWERVETHLLRGRPQFILFQCGVDSLAGDPLTHLAWSPAAHAHAARRLRALADELCGGRLVALGGGGYDLGNIGRGWTAVVRELVDPVAGAVHRPVESATL